MTSREVRLVVRTKDLRRIPYPLYRMNYVEYIHAIVLTLCFFDVRPNGDFAIVQIDQHLLIATTLLYVLGQPCDSGNLAVKMVFGMSLIT